MPRAKKAKVEKAEVVESGEIVEPEPPKPFLFEPPQPAEPISCERQWSSAKEHQMVLRAIAVGCGEAVEAKGPGECAAGESMECCITSPQCEVCSVGKAA